MAKSGTHSVADVFATHYRSNHEPEADQLLSFICDLWDGTVHGTHPLRQFLLARDRRLGLEVEASNPLGMVVAELQELFPEACFLLTVRDPRSWLQSQINHQLGRRPPTTNWRRWRDLRFGAGGRSHCAHERPLAERGLYTLDGYLSHWAHHHTLVLDAVPSCRRLVIRTHEIGEKLPEIAAFAGVPASTLDASGAHSFSSSNTFGVLEQLDPVLVEEKIQQHCMKVLCDLEEAMRVARPAPGEP